MFEGNTKSPPPPSVEDFVDGVTLASVALVWPLEPMLGFYVFVGGGSNWSRLILLELSTISRLLIGFNWP